ncbi:ABC-type polysaccharide/polyol phosphate transport system, ATPase component [Sharpea azabuensis]|uniref:ABC transporter ATP-binding protein n=1 Tax=Sharpea azabuensis TaxID=322505 RepID=UPI0008EA4A3D|nr:ABC transporter ATP-binding protein [Sharpea azabuensis]SFD56868.1 ABC-type polysaccharide/polyol phosphate transport system, ATPase component [Sharpea azabuensis]SFK56785.1 ABC-type polysaccharide/polyol phosphate transport system, ATPase component [Sharpea azabuensis]
MRPENAIEVRNMSKSFKIQYDKAKTLKERLVFWNRGDVQYHQVLKNINLDIKKGETAALIGTNGSGKSTLLKLMTKIIYPNEGTIETDGKLTSLLELGAGFHPDFTGRENIYFNAAIFGLTEKEIDRRVDDIIAFSELGSAIDEPVRTYSSGMYMRLAFSVAINVDADILLIDEILAVGDQHFQDKCYAKLEELKRDENKTIVIVSHSLDVVKKLCNRAIWIYKGEFRLDGDPTYVIDEYLKQIALDHKEEKIQAVAKGEAEYRGVFYIDTPKDFAFIARSTSSLKLAGWSVSDCEKAKLVFKIGDKSFTNITHVKRTDVYAIYQEEYGGFIDADTIGWAIDIPMSEVESEINDNHLYVKVELQNDHGKVMSDKDLTLTIE